MNAFRSSLRMNAGTSVVNGTSDNSFVSLYVSPEISAKRFTSLIWIFASLIINSRIGPSAFQKFRLCDFSLIERLNCLFVDLLERWPHDKKCQKQCQTDQNLIGWCRLRSDRSPKEMKYNDNSCKRSHHNQNRWCK